MEKKIQIDFKFAKNWKTFLSWYDGYTAKAKCAPMWEAQAKQIESCFEPSNPGIVSWKMLWKDFAVWYKKTMEKNSIILWSEQKRQIETLMLEQLKELNKEQFILVFRYKGKPEMHQEKMTYWEAMRLKAKLEGDENGRGGDEDTEDINVVNLNKLIS